MMRLQDPDYTKILLVTLPETTPVLEASILEDDLKRAGIQPWAWVINQSLAAATTTSPLLRHRAIQEQGPVDSVRARAKPARHRPPAARGTHRTQAARPAWPPEEHHGSTAAVLDRITPTSPRGDLTTHAESNPPGAG